MQTANDWFAAIKDRNHNAVSKNMNAFQGTRNSQGETALMQAVRSRDIQMVKLLAPLEAGIVNSDGETALMIAARIDFADGAKYLHSLEGHLHNRNGQTALMVAAMNDCSSVIRRLMPETRYDVDSLGCTALALAAEANAIEAMRALTTHTNMIYDMDSSSAIVYAIIKRNQEALTYLSEFTKESGESLRLSTTKAPTYSKIPSTTTPQDMSSSSGLSSKVLKQFLDQEIDNKLAILKRRITDARDYSGNDIIQKKVMENQVEVLNTVIVLMNQHRDKLEAQMARGSTTERRKSSVTQMKNTPRSGSISSSVRAGSTRKPPTGPSGYEAEASSPKGVKGRSMSKSGRRGEDLEPWKPLGGRGGKTFDEIAAEAQKQHYPTNNGSNVRYPTPRTGRSASSTQGHTLRNSISGNTPQMLASSTDHLRGSISGSQYGLHRSKIPQPDFSPAGNYNAINRGSDSGTSLMMSTGTRNKFIEIYQRKLEDKLEAIKLTLMENRTGLLRLNKRTDNLVRVMRELKKIIESDDELRRLNVNWERAIDARIENLTNELRILSASTLSTLPSSSYFYGVGNAGQSVEEMIEYILRTDDGDDGRIEDDDENAFHNVATPPVESFSVNRNVSPEPSPILATEVHYSSSLERAMTENEKLGVAVNRNPQLGRLLSDKENLLNAVLLSDALLDTFISDFSVVDLLSGNDDLIRKVCVYTDIAAVLFQDEAVAREISMDPGLIDQIAADPSVLEIICKDKSTATKLINALPKLPGATKEDVQEGTLLYEVIVENLNPSPPGSPNIGKEISIDTNVPDSSICERSIDSTSMSLKSQYSSGMGPLFAEGERIKAPGSYLKQLYVSKQHPGVKAESMCELAAQLIDKADEALEVPETISATLTPLMNAAKNNDAKTVKQLISTQAKKQTINGDTALMYASRNGHVKIIKDLLPVESKMQMKNGETALISAVRHGQPKSIKLLLPHEAKMQSNDGHTALMHAVLSNRPVLVKALAKAEHGVQTSDTQASALMYAAESGQIPLAKPLVKLEAGKRNVDNKTAMMMAAEQGNLPLVKALVKTEGGMQDNNGYTAMIYAAMNGHKAICVALNKVEGALKDNDGRTAQDWASQAGHDECAMTMTPKTMTLKGTPGSKSSVFSTKAIRGTKSFSNS